MNVVKNENAVNQPHQINMGIKIYNILVLLIDISVLLFQWVYITLEGFYRTLIVPEELDNVTNEIVMITGAAHGIGKELATQYSKLGATVICVDINESLLNETVNEIKSSGGKAFAYICNVTNRDKCFELAKSIKSDVGSVKIIVNNAGIMPTRSILQQSEADIRNTFDLNVIAHLWMFQAFLPDMIENNKGHFVAISSIAGIIGAKNVVPYCGSKFAVRGLMEAMSEELREKNLKIKFTTIIPFMVDTGLCKKPFTRFPSLMKLLEPKEVAANIISAQRRGLVNMSCPRYLIYLNNVIRIFPHKVGQVLGDFLSTGLDEDHVATHTGENLYTCPYCPKTFSCRGNMHKHRKASHFTEWKRDQSKYLRSRAPK